MKGKYQKSILSLNDLDQYRYENIFKLYQTGDKNFYYYNIAKKIELPSTLEDRFFSTLILPSNLPLTSLSFDIYGTINLWWLILIVNKIQNPIKDIPSGRKIKFVKPKFVPVIIESIQSQL